MGALDQVMTYRGKGQVQITVISVYQVVTDKLQLEASTAAAQQRSLLMNSHDPLKCTKEGIQTGSYNVCYSMHYCRTGNHDCW
jgi:hypothetical protein